MEGWNGKILEIDLTTQMVDEQPLDKEMARLFLGGRGLGARLLWDLVGPGVDPLSPENVLIFATGPLTASGAQTSNRFSVSTKSPLTGTVLDANSGGWWGMQFKRTGYDVLIVRGKSEKPVWLEITPAGVAFNEAAELWGKGVFETTAALGQNNNKRNVLCIGPAGENLTLMAAIMNDRERALARGGPGAVMGSKNLKAIVVAGSEKNQPADKEKFKFMLYETGKLIKASPLTSQALPEFGTAVVMNVMNEIGALPARNFQQSQFEQAEAISGEALTDTILVKNQACWACPIACTRISKTEAGEGEGPEYETTWSFGAQCGVGDLEAIFEANMVCNDMGMDTISVGSTIGCAMELAERGLIDTELQFGRADLLAKTVREIALRQGLGDEMAEGSYRFAEKYGHPELSMSAKKLEMPAYDPRGMQGQGLLFATSNRGACHMRGNMLGPEVLALPRLIDRFANQGKAGIVANHQNTSAVIDSLVLCKFTNMAVSVEFFARLLTAVSGLEFSADDLMKVGERTWNMERLYNLREGFSKVDDTLP
ncbi:MAG TPA: aldehyde ferredoxin oxidoreductase, partial [Chloroflexi bacterium]|nr:aldehyde ferredoxin oxidoreductase [Chloroflexota bacterium]